MLLVNVIIILIGTILTVRSIMRRVGVTALVVSGDYDERRKD